VVIPEWAKDRTGMQGDTAPQAFPVSFDDIRHVIPLEDTETGKTQNVIVQHAYAAGPYTERADHSKLPRYTRYVSGLDIEIPWPLEEEPVITDSDMDTTRMAAETSTFTPTLAQPPMPSSVIDELRNKYSRFRTRHDPEYLKAKMMEDYRTEYRETVSMMTPKTDAQNLRAARFAEQRKAKVEEGLTKASLNFIARHLKTHAISTPPKQPKKAKKSKSKQAA
jgi:large subunit ribosomal protein L24